MRLAISWSSIVALMLAGAACIPPPVSVYGGIAKSGDTLYLTGADVSQYRTVPWVKRCVERGAHLVCEGLDVVSGAVPSPSPVSGGGPVALAVTQASPDVTVAPGCEALGQGGRAASHVRVTDATCEMAGHSLRGGEVFRLVASSPAGAGSAVVEDAAGVRGNIACRCLSPL